MKCPCCESEKIVDARHGLRGYYTTLKYQLCKAIVSLMGYRTGEIRPKYHCTDCGKDFGTEPLLCSKRGIEDYRDIVTSIRFSVGSWDDSAVITFERTSTGILAEIRSIGGYPLDETLTVTEEEWRAMLDTLYGKLFLHEWEKEFDDPNILDGTQWELDLHLTGKRVREYYGSNDYPPYWDEMYALFRPYLPKRSYFDDEDDYTRNSAFVSG